GYLVRSQYHLLEPPIPRDILAGLKTLPEQDHPFTSTGSVKQGYLYRFDLDSLSELVPRFETNWPSFVRDNVLDHPSHGASYVSRPERNGLSRNLGAVLKREGRFETRFPHLRCYRDAETQG